MSQKKILVIDDDPEVRLGMSVRLKAEDYAAVFAGDGVASIAEARRHMPDLIILDLGIPVGDGFTVLERLKANDSLSMIPVVVVTGRVRIPNRDLALKAGAVAFLQKPVDNARLFSLIRQILGDKSNSPTQIHELSQRGPHSSWSATPGTQASGLD